jgi:hypothetical protein
MKVYPNYMPLVMIQAPEWFKDNGFKKWLNEGRPATWHKPGEEPGEHSDVFTAFCDGGCSDYPGDDKRPGIPEHIWEQILDVIEETGLDLDTNDCIVWIENIEPYESRARG